jgi:hypothetical protein
MESGGPRGGCGLLVTLRFANNEGRRREETSQRIQNTIDNEPTSLEEAGARDMEVWRGKGNEDQSQSRCSNNLASETEAALAPSTIIAVAEGEAERERNKFTNTLESLINWSN